MEAATRARCVHDNQPNWLLSMSRPRELIQSAPRFWEQIHHAAEGLTFLIADCHYMDEASAVTNRPTSATENYSPKGPSMKSFNARISPTGQVAGSALAGVAQRLRALRSAVRRGVLEMRCMLSGDDAAAWR